MKKMNVNEMKNINGGVAFTTLCGWALYGWTVSCVAGAVKKFIKRK